MKNFSNTPVYIQNSYTRKKEEFTPLTPGKVGMYVCGPTVYGAPHLGHARAAITFDTVFRYFKQLDYKVRYVRNITDVGHLENEAEDSGEDKIAKKARLEELEPMEVVQTYTNMYHDALQKLNALPPSIEPCASGHIPEQIALIEKILANGYAYEKNGSVYLDMEKYRKDYQYGVLSGKVLDDLLSGSRSLEGQEEKQSAHDFALWKKASPSHIMQWDSPWGKGFPGWHLECTTMSHKYLGEKFDIHGGGLDLQFPHHEGEIAQSCSALGHEPCNYWMHNNMVTLDGQKMAKSKGNFISLDEMFTGDHPLLEKAYSPMTIRFFFLQSHYSSTIDFSNAALQAAEKGFAKLMNALEVLQTLEGAGLGNDELLNKDIQGLCDTCYTEMSNDFNTAKTIAALFELASKIYALKNNQLQISGLSQETFLLLKNTFSDFVVHVLGLSPELVNQSNGALDKAMGIIINLRKEARAEKNWPLSDKIRDELNAAGIQLKDESNGTTTYSIG